MIDYLIVHNINGKQYVGMTARSARRRFREHIRSSKAPRTPLHHAICKYGEGAFDILVLHTVSSRAEAVALERREIASRQTVAPGGYNVTPGGDGQAAGYSPSKETRIKASEAQKARWGAMTPEQRAEIGRAISAGAKGVTHVIKGPSALKGRTRSAEFKEKVSAGMRRVCASLPSGEMSRRSRHRKQNNV